MDLVAIIRRLLLILIRLQKLCRMEEVDAGVDVERNREGGAEEEIGTIVEVIAIQIVAEDSDRT